MIDTKRVSFYENRSDNMSCSLACMRSALEYFDERDYTWEELEKLTGFKPGRAAWTVKPWTTLVQQGFDIQMIENFDYERYAKEGETYLKTFLKPHELTWQLEHSNLLEIQPLIPTFLETVHYTQKSPTLSDIDRLLKNGYLVTVQLNLSLLNNKSGYTAHMILVFDQNEYEYIVHDPGLPGRPSRHIPKNLVYDAMGGVHNTTEVTGIKKEAHNGKS